MAALSETAGDVAGISGTRRLSLAPRLAVALLVAAAMLLGWNLVATALDRDEIADRNESILSLERVLAGLLDVETGARGFLLTGTETFLEPFDRGVRELPRLLGAADQAGREDGHVSLDRLRKLVDGKIAVTQRYVDERRRGASVAQTYTGEGKTVMDEARGEIVHLQGLIAAERAAVVRREGLRTTILTALASLAALSACALFGWLAWQRRRLEQRATEALSGLGDQFRTLADNIPQLAWMADPTGRIYWYNQRWFDYTGLDPNDRSRDAWKRAHDPERVEDVSRGFAAAIETGEPWQDTFPLRSREGGYRWFLSRAQPIRGHDGKVTRWFGTNTDVTEQKEQEVELAAARDVALEANSAKSQFLANMSHELRTPLSAVIGYSEMLEEEVEDLGERHLLGDLSKIKSNARHLLSLINDVLDISKIEANKIELYAETFDVKTMVNEVAATVGSLIDKKGNTLQVQLADDLGEMHSDIVKIRQILINLLSNAAKFTERGTIQLSASRSAGARGAGTLVFAVRDDGLGMSDEQVSRLFARFTQADASTTRRFGGTGLGLAITKAFAEMLGGTVAVESAPGRGSTFTITLPATLKPAADALEIVEEVEDEDVILVVDDDPATRDLLTRFLSREGFAVRVAADGASGLALAEALKPSAILLDVTMPRMDGWEVLRKLKGDPRLAAIPVVMCTVIDEQSLGFSLGATDYILKPVNWDRLKEVLARVAADAPKGDVLVVDDDGDARARLDQLLGKDGWTVTEAGNGLEALDAARRRDPGLVLLDLNMPEMDGFTFLREFRRETRWASVPVVVMTARDLSAAERQELKEGAARIIQKGSVGLPDLVGQLRAVSRGRSGSGARTETRDFERV